MIKHIKKIITGIIVIVLVVYGINILIDWRKKSECEKWLHQYVENSSRFYLTIKQNQQCMDQEVWIPAKIIGEGVNIISD